MNFQENLDLLLQLTRIVQSSFNSDSLPAIILDLTRRVIPYKFATLYLYDPLAERLQAASYVGREVNLIGLVSFDLGAGVSAWVAKRRKPLILSNIHRDQRYDKNALRSFLSVPLIVEDKMVGVLNFGHDSPAAFDELDENLLTVLGGQVALIIHNVELVRRLRESNQELHKTNIRLREMQERLVEQEKMLTIERLMTTLNHEINNPLTVIAGNVELISSYLDESNTPIQQKLNLILEEVRRLGRTLQLLANMETPVVETYLEGREMFNPEASSFLVG